MRLSWRTAKYNRAAKSRHLRRVYLPAAIRGAAGVRLPPVRAGFLGKIHTHDAPGYRGQSQPKVPAVSKLKWRDHRRIPEYQCIRRALSICVDKGPNVYQNRGEFPATRNTAMILRARTQCASREIGPNQLMSRHYANHRTEELRAWRGGAGIK